MCLKWGDELPGVATPRSRRSPWTPRRRDAATLRDVSRLRVFVASGNFPCSRKYAYNTRKTRTSLGKPRVPEIFRILGVASSETHENGKKRNFFISGGDLPHFGRFKLRKAGKPEEVEASSFQAGTFRILGVSSSEKQENRKIFGKTKGSGDLPHLRRFKLRKAGKREERKLLRFRRGSSAF